MNPGDFFWFRWYGDDYVDEWTIGQVEHTTAEDRGLLRELVDGEFYYSRMGSDESYYVKSYKMELGPVIPKYEQQTKPA